MQHVVELLIKSRSLYPTWLINPFVFNEAITTEEQFFNGNEFLSSTQHLHELVGVQVSYSQS